MDTFSDIVKFAAILGSTVLAASLFKDLMSNIEVIRMVMRRKRASRTVTRNSVVLDERVGISAYSDRLDYKNIIFSLPAFIAEAYLPKNSALFRLSVYLNSAMFSVLSELEKKIASSELSEKRQLTIVGVMFGGKVKSAARYQMFLMLALFAHLMLATFGIRPLSLAVVLVVVIGMLSIYADQKLIEFRIRKGWYGQNQYETLELVSFLINHPTKDDFRDGDGYKKLLPRAELDSLKRQWSEGLQGAAQ